MKPKTLALILILVGFILITSLACTISMGPDPLQTIQPTRTLADQVYIIMTVEAAPVRQVAVVATVASDPAVAASYDPALLAEGQTQFTSICSACHGMDAHGLPNLGKDLTNSDFARGLSDQDLINFIKMGRPIWDPLNTTGIDMPAKGGNPALTDDQLVAIVTYLRSLDLQYVPPANAQASLPTEAASLATATHTTQPQTLSLAVAPTAQPTLVPPTPAPLNSTDLVAQGQQNFIATCSACHGADAHGLPKLGKNLLASEFVHGLSDDDLLTFIKTGRPIWDPLNTTGIDMPAKGGNPALTDDQILSIIAFLRANAE